jgi:hypothetical protein
MPRSGPVLLRYGGRAGPGSTCRRLLRSVAAVLSRVPFECLTVYVDLLALGLDVRRKRVALAVAQSVVPIVALGDEIHVTINGGNVLAEQAVLFFAMRQCSLSF